MDNTTQIIITIVGVLGTAGLWEFLKVRLKAKHEARKDKINNDDGIMYRDDLKNRVRNLEALLAKSADREDELNKMVLELTQEVSELRVKVNFLEMENQRLKNI